MADSLNHDLQDALKEAGASEGAARSGARSVASALDMAKALIWIKALIVMTGALVAINVAILNQLFTLTEQVGKNTIAIAELRRGQEELRRGQEEIRGRQNEILSLLRIRLSDSGADAPSPPAISAVPATPESVVPIKP